MFRYSLSLAVPFAVLASASVADTPKLHPLENLCVVYEMKGAPTDGSITRCHRNFGHETYEIEDITIDQVNILTFIEENPELPIEDIAVLTFTDDTDSTILQIINTMVEKNYLKQSTDDKNKKTIAIKKQGKNK